MGMLQGILWRERPTPKPEQNWATPLWKSPKGWASKTRSWHYLWQVHLCVRARPSAHGTAVAHGNALDRRRPPYQCVALAATTLPAVGTHLCHQHKLGDRRIHRHPHPIGHDDRWMSIA